MPVIIDVIFSLTHVVILNYVSDLPYYTLPNAFNAYLFVERLHCYTYLVTAVDVCKVFIKKKKLEV